jgi:hypothetical protein
MDRFGTIGASSPDSGWLRNGEIKNFGAEAPSSQARRRALEHFAFRWNDLKVSKMLQSQKHRASFARKTAHTFAHDALARRQSLSPRRNGNDLA